MTDEELRQLIESNARAIQGNIESIQQLTQQSQRIDARMENLSTKLDRLSDIVLGNYRNIVRVETGTTHNEGKIIDAIERINALERRLEALENPQSEND